MTATLRSAPKRSGEKLPGRTLPARARVALAAIAMGLGLSACGVGTVPALEERAKSAWSEVQNQYQRRADLVPSLAGALKGAAPQEREVLTQVAQAHARATQVRVDAATITDPQAFKQFQDAQNQLSGALGRLLAAAERYPELKASAAFIALRSQLEGTENRIAVARRDYMETVRDHNRTLRTLPGRWIAAMLYPNAKPMETFAAETG